MTRLFTVFAAAVVVAFPAGAQQYQRRATMVGGGGDRGKCTIEVVVDGIAEVEIRGDQGIIRNIEGRPAEWRRFQCNAPLPLNPAEFRFAGVDGRGRQQLVRDPRNGGVAVVRIEDPQSGSEGYTFDLFWNGVNIPAPDRFPERERFPERAPRRYSVEQAVSVCQDSVRAQAGDRFRGRRVEFLNTRIDDNPGRNDWVVGMIDVFRGPVAEERFRFSCSVNFDNGQVRSVQIDPVENRDRPSRRFTTEQAVNVCQDAVRRQAEGRFRERRVEFLSTRIDENPGRNDWVIGTIEVFGRDFSEGRYRFSCAVNFDNGEVRSADIDPRRM